MKHLPTALTDPWFEAHFYNEASATSHRDEHHDGTQIAFGEAQGLLLWCPCGYDELMPDGSELFPTDLSLNRGRPHLCQIPFSNPPCGVPVPADHGPLSRDGKTRPRWVVSGAGLYNLTLSPSVAVGKPECWHGFIQAGVVKNA